MHHKRLYYNPEDDWWLKKRRYRSDNAEELFDEVDLETDLTPSSAPVQSTACESSPPPFLLGFDVDEDDDSEFQMQAIISQPC